MTTMLERLKARANMKPLRKVAKMHDGTEEVFYHPPLTMAQRERADKMAEENGISWVLQLVINNAKDENGLPLFTQGQVAELRNEVWDEDLQAIMLAYLQKPEEESEKVDMKSPEKGAAK